MNYGMKADFCLYLLSLLAASAIATSQHLVCKTVENVFSETAQYPAHHDPDAQGHNTQGRPGKRGAIGPRGLAGPPGMKGETGNVDFKNITRMVKATVEEELIAIIGRLDDLQKNVTDLSRRTKELACGLSNLHYNGSCYRVARFSQSRVINRQGAIETCHNIGFNVLQINDRTEQEIVENFVRSSITFSATEVYFWLDMTYDHATRMLRYRTGEQAEMNHLSWYPSYPKDVSANVYIMLGVKKSGGDGIWNYSDYEAHGVICEKQI